MELFGEQIAALLDGTAPPFGGADAQPPDPRSAQRSAAVSLPGVTTPTPGAVPNETPAARSAFPGPVAVPASQTHATPFAMAGQESPAGVQALPSPPSRRVGMIVIAVLVRSPARGSRRW